MDDGEIDEFFAQDVPTGPPMPGEQINQPRRDMNTTTEHPPLQSVAEPTPPPQQPAAAEANVSGRKVTLTFTRSKQEAKFNQATATGSVEFDIEDGASTDSIDARILGEMASLKAMILEQLGLTFTYDPETRIVMENLLEGATTVASVPVNPGAGTGFNAPPVQQQYQQPAAQAVDQGAMWGTVVAELQQGPPQSFFDNRGDKGGNPKRPDFKFKNTSPFNGEALWMNTCPDEYKQFFGIG